MILDTNSILLMMGLSFVAGLIINLISEGLGKILAVIMIFPFFAFLAGAVNSGMKIDNPTELGSWVTVIVTNMVPFILSYASEGAGTGLAKGIKKAFK